MTKNVTVLDENGNILGTTFEKRAEGLIKKGRARRVSDTEICLAPSASITEENMSEELTLGYVLAKIDEIAKSMDYVHESIKEIGQSAADPMKAQSLADVVGYRETTNQQLLRLYEKMYDDLKCPRSGDIRERALGVLKEAVGSDEDTINAIRNAMDTIMHM